jgi:hypothetical protein
MILPEMLSDRSSTISVLDNPLEYLNESQKLNLITWTNYQLYFIHLVI